MSFLFAAVLSREVVFVVELRLAKSGKSCVVKRRMCLMMRFVWRWVLCDGRSGLKRRKMEGLLRRKRRREHRY